ncbi:MAG TPA: hypothetical protein V6C89_07485 [Drouetiella sp.]
MKHYSTGHSLNLLAIALTGVSLIFECNSSAFAQSQKPTPEEIKASLAGMSKEQIKAKYMAIAAPNLHFSDKWPVNFPLPKYMNNVVSTRWINTTKGAPSAVASLNTKDSPEMVYKFYLDSCNQNGWKTKAPTAKTMQGSGGNFFMLEGTKENQMIRLISAPNAKIHGTTLSISWFKIRPPAG